MRRRAEWPTDRLEGTARSDTDPMDRSDYIAAAKDLEGSQDTANQLFCALLRSVGVEARLVYSLQPLPFANAPVKSVTLQKVVKPTVFAMASATDSAASDSNPEDTSVQHSSSIGKVPSVRRRLGQPSFAQEPAATPPPNKRKPICKLSYPIFWVEAFDSAHQRWLPIDPIVTQTVNKPSKLEPPSSYTLNQLSYVIAFEDDGVARDVTRRYAKAYNAKTRRHRVESSENGAQWFKKAVRVFRRRGPVLDRDQVEDAELAQKEAREGLPGNVQDFRDHPYYALERHLKRHEVISPKREVGKVNAGTAARPRMEVVFRRQDVLVCRSAERWYRSGREIQEGEQAVKRVPARVSRRMRSPVSGEEEGEREMTALYAPFQTQLYVPPPVTQGRIPKNVYGNLDIYVPSMVPAGGTHIRHPSAREAAQRILKIDCAEAVTGFEFKGRHGTAIKEGVIVAEQYADAVREVIESLTDEQTEQESMARSAVALRMWKRFLTGLRIAERVSAYGDPGNRGDLSEGMENEQDDADEAGGGGFLPADQEVALPTAGRFSLGQLSTPAKTNKKTVRDNESESSEAEFSEGENSGR